MARATNAPASRQRRKRRLELAKGFRGARSKQFRLATEAVDRAQRLSTIHRKLKKRDYRSLWIVRLSAACRSRGLTYSRFIEGLTKAKVRLNRKMLSEIAIQDPEGFSGVQVPEDNALAGVHRDHIAARTKNKWWHARRDFSHGFPVRTGKYMHPCGGMRRQ